MKKKNQFLFSLLMAIVMMAMSPMKMWAETVTITASPDGPTVIRQCSLNAGDELNVKVSYNSISLSNLGCTSNNYNSQGGNNYSITESGEYMIIISNPKCTYISDPDGVLATSVYSANVELHKITCISADANTDCSHIGQLEHWKCSSCSKMWNMALEQIQSAPTGYGNHKFVDGKCSVCSIVTPTLTEAQQDTYSWTTSDKIGYMPGLMSTNKGQGSSTSESTYSFSVSKAGRLMFDWAVSSESGYDKLTITLDGSVVVDNVSGTAKGNIVQLINSGDHTLILSYSKDSGTDTNDDRGYLYNLLFCDHSGNTNTAVHIAATCTTGSHDAHTCSVCGFQYDTNVQDDLLAHSYVNGKCVNGCNGMPSNMDASSFVDGTAYERTSAGTVGTLTYKRTISSTNWQALYVPFQMSYSDWSEDFDVATIQNFHEYTDENGVVQNIVLEVRYVKSGKLKANHPYLIRPKTAGEKTITLSNATLAKAESKNIVCQSVERKYTFTGIYSPMQNLYTNDYLFMTGGSLMKAMDDDTTLKAQRWYLAIQNLDAQVESGSTSSGTNNAISISVIGDDDATGIEDIKVVSTPINGSSSAAAGIYDLQGRRQQSLSKGVNIIRQADGTVKKVMVK